MNIDIIDNVFFRLNKIENPIGDIWLIHPFGESGLCYREAFESKLKNKFNIFVPDLPGFGVSPNNGTPLSIQQLTEKLKELINKISPNSNLYIVAHSVSGIIGTSLCKYFGEKINGYVSIEGNLTTKDSYYSSLPIHNSKEDFYRKYLTSVIKNSVSREDFRRYLASIYFADIDSLFEWGKSTEKIISENKPGIEFLVLKCPKVYIWGDKDTPVETQKFIEEKKIPNIFLKGVGHWPMIEVSEKFYNLVNDFFIGNGK